jgi:hypothetical protein
MQRAKPLTGYNTSRRNVRDVFGEMPSRKLVSPPKFAPSARREAAAVPTSSLRLNAAANRPNSSVGLRTGEGPPPPWAEARMDWSEREEGEGRWRGGEIIRGVATEPIAIFFFFVFR